MIVLDASVALELLLRRPGSDATLDRVLSDRSGLHAPHVIDLEVAQVLRRYVSRTELTAARAREALDVLAVFPLSRYPETPLLRRIWELRDNLTAYDGAYVALAEALRATLVTRDARLAGAPGVRAEVELV